MKKTIVTGGQGFIGSNLMKILEDATSYDLKSGQDVLDTRKLKEVMRGHDTVVHLAAYTCIGDSLKDPVRYYKNNVLGTANVIEVAIKNGIKRIIFASSASIYQKYDSPYSATKSMGEDLLKVRSSSIQSVALRFFNVYGKGQNPDYGTVIPAFYNGITKSGEITIYGDGEQTRDFIHVDDVCAGIKAVIDKDITDQCVAVDLGTGVATSINDVAELMTKTLKQKVDVKHGPLREEIKHSLANTHYMRENFNFVPKVSFIKGLGRIKDEGI